MNLNSSTNLTTNSADSNNSMVNEIPPIIPILETTFTVLWTIIFVFGVVGNILTICVLRCKRLGVSSTSLYLSAVAWTDLFYLVGNMGVRIHKRLSMYQLDQYSHFTCVGYYIYNYSVTYISVWLLVAVTIDRMIWVILPFHAKTICTPRHAMIVFIIIIFISLGGNSHFGWTLNYFPMNENRTVARCRLVHYFKTTMVYIDVVITAIVPFFIMLCANVLIIVKLRKVRRIRKRSSSVVSNVLPKLSTVQQPPSEIIDENPDAIKPIDNPPTSESKISSKKQFLSPPSAIPPPNSIENAPMSQKKDRTSNLTMMLLSISIFFMVTATPYLVWNIVFVSVNIHQLVEMNETVLGPLFFVIQNFCMTLWFLNFSVHFLLYCMSGPKFRKEALNLLKVPEWCQNRLRRNQNIQNRENVEYEAMTQIRMNHNNGNGSQHKTADQKTKKKSNLVNRQLE